MRKTKRLLICIFALITTLCCVLGFGCSNNVYFEFDEYTVSTGDKVSSSKKATYVILGEQPDGVSLSQNGVFTITDDAKNGVQVLIGAVVKGKVVDTAICNIVVDMATPVIEVVNLSDYIIDGESILVSAEPECSVSYSIKQENCGVSVDEITGKISFTDKVLDGQEFTVVVSGRGVTKERDFFVAIENLVTATNDVLIVEYKGSDDISVNLQFVSGEQESHNVLGIRYGKTLLNANEYSFNEQNDTLTIKREFLNILKEGENKLNVYTPKNTVILTLKNARLIATANDLVEINGSRESLAGYYIQVCNVDLKNYLSNSNEGWFPIGTYKDVADGTATLNAFNGTYDGNGYSITNFYINRTGEYAFNSGLFGYATTNATISNVSLYKDESKTHSVRSYSGGLVGVNCGVIRNCAVYADVVAENCKTVGVLVGRNEGTIYNSYSVGNASGKERIGAFCGENQGGIYNSYAVTDSNLSFCGIGGKNEILYSTVQEFIDNADFSSWQDWTFEGDGVPSIVGNEVYYPLRLIEVATKRTEYVKDMRFSLATLTDPADIKDMVLTYTLTEGQGITVSQDGFVDLTDAVNGIYTIRIACDTVYTDYTFTVSDTVDDIVQIGTVNEFLEFKLNPENFDKYILLTADIDFAGLTTTSVGYYLEDGESQIFTGTFDGNGHKLSNLNIVRNAYDGLVNGLGYDSYKYHPAYYNVGLFSYLTGTVKNLTIENFAVMPTFDGEGTGNYIGVVCGVNYGLIENCSLISCSYYGADEISVRAGIICGLNNGSINLVTVDGEERW